MKCQTLFSEKKKKKKKKKRQNFINLSPTEFAHKMVKVAVITYLWMIIFVCCVNGPKGPFPNAFIILINVISNH